MLQSDAHLAIFRGALLAITIAPNLLVVAGSLAHTILRRDCGRFAVKCAAYAMARATSGKNLTLAREVNAP